MRTRMYKVNLPIRILGNIRSGCRNEDVFWIPGVEVRSHFCRQRLSRKNSVGTTSLFWKAINPVPDCMAEIHSESQPKRNGEKWPGAGNFCNRFHSQCVDSGNLCPELTSTVPSPTPVILSRAPLYPIDSRSW